MGNPLVSQLRIWWALSNTSISATARLSALTALAVMTAGEAKVGIMPGFIFEPGQVGIVSKSGTLTYEAVDQCTKAGLSQTTAIGIGGDPIIGTTTLDAVKL